jgi:hypothetical protein
MPRWAKKMQQSLPPFNRGRRRGRQAATRLLAPRFQLLAPCLRGLEPRREMPEERRRFDDLKASEILLSVVNLQNSLD